jgi:hypothetical protein
MENELPGPYMPTRTTSPNEDSLNRTLEYVRNQILDGLSHGFFECTIKCEIVKDHKRRVVVKAGKSEQFTIPVDELEL